MNELQKLLVSNQEFLNRLQGITSDYTPERRLQHYKNTLQELLLGHEGIRRRGVGTTGNMLIRAFDLVGKGEKVMILSHTSTHLRFLREFAFELGIPHNLINFRPTRWAVISKGFHQIVGTREYRIYIDHYSLECMEWSQIRELVQDVFTRTNTIHTGAVSGRRIRSEDLSGAGNMQETELRRKAKVRRATAEQPFDALGAPMRYMF